MRFTFVTLFSGLVEGYFSDSILRRALESKLLEIDFKNPRDYSTERHKKTDEYLIGGGAGLLFTPQPLYECLKELKRSSPNAWVLFPTPAGKSFKQNDAKRLSKKEHIVFVCGRYEGIDERVIEQFADELFCIGDFVLSGGELASLVICDAVSRNIKGVLGNDESASFESFEGALLEAPSFTKPNIFNGVGSPSELLKGNHSNIRALKNRLAAAKTKYFRPEMYEKYILTEDKK